MLHNVFFGGIIELGLQLWEQGGVRTDGGWGWLGGGTGLRTGKNERTVRWYTLASWGSVEAFGQLSIVEC